MAITVGQPAPDFTLHETPERQHRLSDYRGSHVVLVFFPGAFTSVCTTEMCALRDRLDQFSALEAQVIGITVDPPFVLDAWKAAHGVDYTFLSDYNREVVRADGVAIPALGGLPGYVAANRAVTIVDKEGVVRYHWVAESLGVEPDYTEIHATVGMKRDLSGSCRRIRRSPIDAEHDCDYCASRMRPGGRLAWCARRRSGPTPTTNWQCK